MEEDIKPIYNDYILNELSLATRGLKANTPQEIEIIFKYDADCPEDTNQYFYSSSCLKEEGAVEEYKAYKLRKSDLKKIGGGRTVGVCRIKYTIIPKNLIKYLIDTSRIPKYSLTLDKQRRLMLNDKYILTTLQFAGTNFYFFDYALKNPNKIVKNYTFSNVIGKTENTKRFHTILEQTIKNSELIKVFFPNVSKDAFEFRNRVTVKDLIGQNINEIDIVRFIKTLIKT